MGFGTQNDPLNFVDGSQVSSSSKGDCHVSLFLSGLNPGCSQGRSWAHYSCSEEPSESEAVGNEIVGINREEKCDRKQCRNQQRNRGIWEAGRRLTGNMEYSRQTEGGSGKYGAAEKKNMMDRRLRRNWGSSKQGEWVRDRSLWERVQVEYLGRESDRMAAHHTQRHKRRKYVSWNYGGVTFSA